MNQNTERDYSYSNTYPNGSQSAGLIGVQETMEEARALEQPYKDKGVRTWIEHAGLKTGSGVVGAYAVYAHPDDLGLVLGL